MPAFMARTSASVAGIRSDVKEALSGGFLLEASLLESLWNLALAVSFRNYHKVKKAMVSIPC